MADLVCDIGGTNVRLAWKAGQAAYAEARSYKVADYSCLEEVIETFCDGREIHDACIALAGPTSENTLALTNAHWRFSRSDIKRQFAINRLEVINDFTAQAWAVPYLDAHEKHQVAKGKAIANTPIAVIGPGTGMGVSGLIPVPQGWSALSGEGGHVSFAPVDDQEIEVLRILQKKFGRVSIERLLSGSGLENIHQALAVIEGLSVPTQTAPAITSAALAAEVSPEGQASLEKQALTMFCAILGSCAGDIALTLGAWGGVYIGGGIVPQILDFFERSPFRSRFEHKGRFESHIAAIPTYVVTAEHPALKGTAAYLSQAS